MKRDLRVQVNGKTYAVQVEAGGDNQYRVRVNEREFEIHIAEEDAQLPAVTAPAPLVVERPALKADTSFNKDALSAPMPGVILDIVVSVGSEVQVGSPLCALEAMKMKNAIRSPRAGVIAAVEVSEGQRVSNGEVLFRYA